MPCPVCGAYACLGLAAVPITGPHNLRFPSNPPGLRWKARSACLGDGDVTTPNRIASRVLGCDGAQSWDERKRAVSFPTISLG